MFELIRAGGWLMAPILICSVVAMAIVIERFLSLRRTRINPPGVLQSVYSEFKSGNLTPEYFESLRRGTPLERVLAAGLVNRKEVRAVMRDAIEEEGRQVVHKMESYLDILATIAAVTPLLGLLGTVIGMIDVFTAIVTSGVGNPGVLAGGISKALVTTAAGLTVAIPSLLFHRVLSNRVEQFALEMEDNAIQLVDAIYRAKQQ